MRKYYHGVKRTWVVKSAYWSYEFIEGLSRVIFYFYGNQISNIKREESDDDMENSRHYQ